MSTIYNKTDNYALNLYGNNDPADLRDGYNGSMRTIDTTLGTHLDRIEGVESRETHDEEVVRTLLGDNTVDAATAAKNKWDDAVSQAATNEDDIAAIDANLNALHANTVDDAGRLYNAIYPTYPTVNALKMCTYPVGTTVRTLGYDAEGDGGGALYTLKNTEPEFGDITLENGVVAGIVETDTMRPEQFGILDDYAPVFNHLMRGGSDVRKLVLTPCKTYPCNDDITAEWSNENGCILDGNNAALDMGVHCLSINETHPDAHDFKGGTYRDLTVKGSGTHVLTVRSLTKGSVSNIRIKGAFARGFTYSAGYETVIDNISVYYTGTNTDAVGIVVDGHDAVFGRLMGYNCPTFMRVNGNANTFDLIHAWIAPKSYAQLYGDSVLIDAAIPVNNSYFTVKTLYADSYRNTIKLSEDNVGIEIGSLFWFLNTVVTPPVDTPYLIANPNGYNTSRIVFRDGRISYNQNLAIVDNGTFLGYNLIYLDPDRELTKYKKQLKTDLFTAYDGVEIISQNCTVMENGLITLSLHVKVTSNVKQYARQPIVFTQKLVYPSDTYATYAMALCSKNQYYEGACEATSIQMRADNGQIKITSPYNNGETYYANVFLTFPMLQQVVGEA